jgi:hypothetical protein
MNQNFVDQDNQNGFAAMNEPQDRNAGLGPIELSILERVENGLIYSDDERVSQENRSLESDKNKNKYEGPKEIIFVSGWVNINSVYSRYFWGFLCKIALGIMLLVSLWKNQQNFWPLALTFVLINLAHIIKNSYYLYVHRKSHTKIKLIFWIELHISIGYFCFFLGFLLIFLQILNPKFLALFALPYLAVSSYLFFTSEENNYFINQKKFAIFEGIQMALIMVKFAAPQFMNWNYILIFFMAGAIYLTVLGLLLTIILSCSLFGFLYRGLEGWKIKSLIWMTWYYLFTGLTFIYIIKGVIEFYDDENLISREQTSNYLKFTSNNPEILITAAMMLIFFNFVNFLMHFFWAEDIKKYLSKVIYKNELRKEISLRALNKNFSFKVIQFSAVFFKRQANPTKEALDKLQMQEEQAASKPVPKKIDSNISDVQSYKDSECIVCFDAKPNIIQDPCGHGGFCKECALEYIKTEDKCMICREKIKKFFLIEFNENETCFYAKGEIKLKF